MLIYLLFKEQPAVQGQRGRKWEGRDLLYLDTLFCSHRECPAHPCGIKYMFPTFIKGTSLLLGQNTQRDKVKSPQLPLLLQTQDLAEDSGERGEDRRGEGGGGRGGGEGRSGGGGDRGEGGEGTAAMVEVETMDGFLPSCASFLHKWMFCLSPGNLDYSHSSLPMNFWFD